MNEKIVCPLSWLMDFVEQCDQNIDFDTVDLDSCLVVIEKRPDGVSFDLKIRPADRYGFAFSV